MHATRVKKAGLLALIPAALLGVALFAACDSIDGAGPGNGRPTDPTPGGDPSQRGTMTLSPSDFTLTIGGGGTGGGLFFFFDLAGGKPPFVWSNSWTQMGLLIPLDDQGLGYANRAKYVVRDFGGTGDDTITVRDQSGAIVTAKFTKVVEDPVAPTAPTITPSAATIISGSSISLLASGGNGTYLWSASLPPPGAGFNAPPITLPDAPGRRVTFYTEAFTGTADKVVTVSVLSNGLLGTATITLKPTGP